MSSRELLAQILLESVDWDNILRRQDWTQTEVCQTCYENALFEFNWDEDAKLLIKYLAYFHIDYSSRLIMGTNLKGSDIKLLLSYFLLMHTFLNAQNKAQAWSATSLLFPYNNEGWLQMPTARLCQTSISTEEIKCNGYVGYCLSKTNSKHTFISSPQCTPALLAAVDRSQHSLTSYADFPLLPDPLPHSVLLQEGRLRTPKDLAV